MIQYGHQYIDDEDIKAVTEVLKSDFLTQGPAVSLFENKICEITGACYCVAVSNATAGLHIAVQALNLPEASEGITTPNTFLASANCFLYNKLKPVFADINPDTYNIDPNQIEKKITVDTKVIIPVHFAGLACDMERIKKTADARNIKIIEDAAHAIGSFYADGTPVGNCKYSDMTVFSFHPVKTITTGEGGAITTNDEALYKRLLQLRSHGMTKDTKLLTQNPGPWYYEMHSIGFNYRMTDIQAALGYSQLLKLEYFREQRQHIVNQYNTAFDGIPHVKLPYRNSEQVSCFHLYVLQIDFEAIGTTRKDFMKELADKGIGTQVHYIPVHTQPYYKAYYGYKPGDYPIAEQYYERALSIPLYPALSNDDVQKVIDTVKELLNYD
ncbi:UDP-4-amino-4,6-dideoxy-N-acetyl-beta-L-altrosamine transaminase [Treponema denticola]|uniref:UDP-4-amino-4, 6-dideoxy-N-acetyl-beta-L-altrosamine transaminase n=1 Tax=Treponema denticola TaxID=158 RepID=UPI0020A3D7BF|nr:UDP-4-amino-4,6-dideoxy-N-acetyl-beta-L-altrosamine transaminase [Treponema denticola]UTC82357.1 UDP-4-amino-4,6-dideoxy-N-acetyl-beta-L-altrosamine transaminase [Treponema denticola]